MGQRLLRSSPILFTAITMSAAFAHLLEMPAKMRYEPPLYVRLHRTLYWNFGRISGIAEVLSLLSSGGLALWLRKRRDKAFPLTASASLALAAAHGAFWTWVAPANKTMLSWSLDAIPADWTKWRDQWEYTHAARAMLVTAALAAMVYSLPADENENAVARAF